MASLDKDRSLSKNLARPRHMPYDNFQYTCASTNIKISVYFTLAIKETLLNLLGILFPLSNH